MGFNVVLTIVIFFFTWKLGAFSDKVCKLHYQVHYWAVINNTYTIKLLLNGLKFWNAVSVGLHIVLLNNFCCIKLMICLDYA